MKTLRNFLKQHYLKPIPLMALTPKLIILFSELQHGVTSLPVLNWFDPDQPTLFKKEWSLEMMVWILTQPATDK